MPGLVAALLVWLSLGIGGPGLAATEMQAVGRFEIDRTEVTIGAFRAFVRATGTLTTAEREAGGFVYEGGWRRLPGWAWATPFGRPGADDEPAVHVTFDEAQAYCRWAGKRLPTDAEWLEAAYTERRADPPAGFAPGRTYPYPTGESPAGANCLEECGAVQTVRVGTEITRGRGHARAGTTRAGVNGLFDMGANVWEWTENGGDREKGTRGGSWWYGTAQMRADAVYTKPRDFPAVYIGFRCARDRR
jgi:sulfatase modifying factor 1